MAAQDPKNILARYGLAMEYLKADLFDDAINAFRSVISINENYAAAYFHGGQTYEKMGQLDEAKAMYQAAIDNATRQGQTQLASQIKADLSAVK